MGIEWEDDQEAPKEEAPQRPTDQEVEDRRNAERNSERDEHNARRLGKPWPPEDAA